MSIIRVKDLRKEFKVHQKEPGLLGSVKSLFHREYEKVEAVKDISFDIEKGELIGFIGPNGAGKTTTLKMLSGLLYPTSGQIEVMGFTPQDRKTDFLKNLSLVMGQKNQLWWDLPPMETFLLNQAIYEVPDNKFKKTLDSLIELLNVQDILKVQVRKLSLGQRMKCELIAALLHSPKVLFLDEPTIGLDVVMQKTIRDFIKDYNREFKSTIILTSHYMDDVKELCKRVIIIDHGQILFDGQLKEIIDTYARDKLLTLTFADNPKPSQLEKYGKIKELLMPTVKLAVPRSKATQTAADLLEKFEIEDVTIEEPSIEAIIREVFSKSEVSE